MTISDLARALGVHRGNLSSVINGTRLSRKTEEKIAAYLGVACQELFRCRSRSEISAMREALAKKGGAA
jgi:plasmid maintenance system antidote protein VapI